jgi:hypothetical protein
VLDADDGQPDFEAPKSQFGGRAVFPPGGCADGKPIG